VKDVAARSGVSFQTTSKVLNGKGSVSEVTRARIIRAARELGYVPNLLARSLVMHSTRAVGLVASDFSDPHLNRFVVGAEEEARRRGYSVIITGVESEGSGDEAIPALIERRVDGILLAAPDMDAERVRKQTPHLTTPLISLHHVPIRVSAVVGCDDEEIGHLATSHLLERGHRHVGTVIGQLRRHATRGRLHGYRRALEEAGIEFAPVLVAEGGGDMATALAATLELMNRRPDVTAIFAQNDTIAVGVLAGLRRLGRRVPEDCAVVGCDDIDVAAYTSPSLTSVRVPFNEVGEAAMRALLDMIEAGAMEQPNIVLPVQLVVREST
jgi:LacI family transcriptional regulator